MWDLTSQNNTSHKRIYIDEGWCETWHHITIHHKRIDIDEGWRETWHHITIHHKRIDIDEGRCETKGSGDEGRWWQRECGDFGKWWRRECGDIGKWWLREVVTHCNGCMNVAWGLCWGGSRSTKPCVFPRKVASAGDERYLLCAAGVAGVVPSVMGSSFVFRNEWLFLCA